MLVRSKAKLRCARALRVHKTPIQSRNGKITPLSVLCYIRYTLYVYIIHERCIYLIVSICLLETVKTLRRAYVVFLRVSHLWFKLSWSSSFHRIRLLFLLLFIIFFSHTRVNVKSFAQVFASVTKTRIYVNKARLVNKSFCSVARIQEKSIRQLLCRFLLKQLGLGIFFNYYWQEWR